MKRHPARHVRFQLLPILDAPFGRFYTRGSDVFPIFAADSMMEIQVNGESKTVPPDATVAWLISHLELEPKFVAVEKNRELVPRTQHAGCRLQSGDEIEIVTLVGGG